MRHLFSVAFLLASWTAHAADIEAWAASYKDALRLIEAGQYRAAEPFAQQSLKQAEQYGSMNVRVGYALEPFGVVQFNLGKLPEAERSFVRAIRVLQADGGYPLALALLETDLGTLHGVAGRWTQAEEALRTALQLRETALGPSDPVVGNALSHLASVLMRKDDLKGARSLLERALTMAEKPGSPYRITASVLNSLGVLACKERKLEEGLAHFARAMDLWRESRGAGHPDLITPLLNSGRVYLELHRPAAAVQALREAQGIAEANLGPTHPMLAEVLISYADALGKTGERKQAHEIERRGQAIFKLYPERNGTVSMADLVGASRRR